MSEQIEPKDIGGSNKPQHLFLVILAVLLLVGVVVFLNKTTLTKPEPVSLSPGRKIIPPNQGIYLGQTQRQPGDVQAFESAVQKVAFWPYEVMSGQEEAGEGTLSFDIQTAEKAWQEKYLVRVSAYEATPVHKPFTVDNLLQGKYDTDLKKLAKQFRQFGKPMFFSTMREPNGVLAEWMGGFGPNGNQNIEWAFKNKKGVAEFNPRKFPNPKLYEGLGRDGTCDGLERAVAAQRYYYDFFVNKEKLDFLTFETMGWAIPSIKKSTADEGYETKLSRDCNDFAKFYNSLKDYSDWISIDWYLVTETTPNEPPISQYMDNFHEFMKELRATGTKKPVLFAELGFCGINKDKKVETALRDFLNNYSEIRGFALWGSVRPGEQGFDCLIRPNTPEAAAFRKIIHEQPKRWYSNAYFSDGTKIPN